MLHEIVTVSLYSASFVALLIIDYLLGNGFVDMFHKFTCRIVCFVRKSIREDDRLNEMTGTDVVISLPFLITEIILLGLSIGFLNKYKDMRCRDKIDELLKDSREALRQTNEFLEKWRLRRLNCQVPNEYTYLDDEPQRIEPYKLEVPILHMAIIDNDFGLLPKTKTGDSTNDTFDEGTEESILTKKIIFLKRFISVISLRHVSSAVFSCFIAGFILTLGTTRSQPERGDAGDTINITDSTLLSVTSLLDDDFESITEPMSEETINESLGKSIAEFKDRYLWDLVEEDE